MCLCVCVWEAAPAIIQTTGGSDVAADRTAISNILQTLATKPRNGEHSGRAADGRETDAATPAPMTVANAEGPLCGPAV